jgi:hypothetical protein
VVGPAAALRNLVAGIPNGAVGREGFRIGIQSRLSLSPAMTHAAPCLAWAGCCAN